MLADVPMVFILVGIAAYTVLSGADFGAGLWTLVPGGGSGLQASVAATRDHTRHAIGPVWEANHVWLIFVLTVAWTCYPGAFGSIVSTLAIPLLIAAIGIIFRGTAYALRSQFSRDEEHGVRPVEYLFALSSVLTPFALATVIGAIATGRVPVGNARGDLVTSWLNPVSVLAGVLAVAFSGYLAAVYLAADAQRLTERALVHDFRIRALASGVVAGALALAGLLVIRVSARPLWDGLTSGLGLVLVIVSALAGVVTMVLVFAGRFGPARASAALAVAAVIAGWAAAQSPFVLPGLTVAEAAAGRSTLIATIVGVAVGAVVLVPSLAVLYSLVLRGRLDTADTAGTGSGGVPPGADRRSPRASLAAGFAVVTLVAGVGLLVFAEPAWANGLGAVALIACAVTVFTLVSRPAAELASRQRRRRAGRWRGHGRIPAPGWRPGRYLYRHGYLLVLSARRDGNLIMDEIEPVEVTVWVPASPPDVFGFFTDPDRYVQWMGSSAELEPVPGGVYRVSMADGFAAAGRFVSVSHPHLVVFSWGFADDEAASRTKHAGRTGESAGAGADAGPGARAMPAGSTRVTVTLLDQDGGTRLTLRHENLPSESLREGHDVAWNTYLPRLAVRAAGGDPGPDPHA